MNTSELMRQNHSRKVIMQPRNIVWYPALMSELGNILSDHHRLVFHNLLLIELMS